MAFRTKYSSIDMIRIVKFAKENPELKPIPLIKAYNEKYPEISEEQKLKNIKDFIGTMECPKCGKPMVNKFNGEPHNIEMCGQSKKAFNKSQEA